MQQSLLWHRRLSYLNFRYTNTLARHGLLYGRPDLHYDKDHLCAGCEKGKMKKALHKPNAEQGSKRPLSLLHMDLCGPMRVQSIVGKKYVIVIVDDYSRYTWVFFLRSKDEASEVIINFIKMCKQFGQIMELNSRTKLYIRFILIWGLHKRFLRHGHLNKMV